VKRKERGGSGTGHGRFAQAELLKLFQLQEFTLCCAKGGCFTETAPFAQGFVYYESIKQGGCFTRKKKQLFFLQKKNSVNRDLESCADSFRVFAAWW
jgi:hypothetical protein